MSRYPKPAAGSWTEHFGLDTGPVSYEDSISPEFYELEREAVFKRAWLNVGRTDLLPRSGSYFTKELAVANTSIVVVRDMEGQIRAFHNICRHRGNKLVWTDYPREETSGTCRQFVCKYHGWRYELDGSCSFVQQQGEFFDLDRSGFGLVPVHCDVWEGFIFVNLDEEPRQTLREFLGPMILGLEGYPFDKLTDRWFYRAKINSNWKLFSDATQEFLHAPVLHFGQSPPAWSIPAREAGFEAPHYQIDGPHRLVTTGGIRPWELPPDKYRPMEGVTRAGLFGPWEPYDIGSVPAGLNPGKAPIWGNQSYQLWPNLVFLFWTQGFYYIYHYWPTSHNTMIYETTIYFPPAKKPSDRVAQEVIALAYKDFGLQDVNTCEATQQMLESRVVERFPLSDQEVLCRHMHKLCVAAVEAYKREKGL
jgi:phenylpropionate dioxygenase-like ring-hydroxylating dioxygenase large terminal subunit